ncbi:MAG: hypothetical protein AAGI01_01575 [Myxococcota bacterium]
MRAWIAASVFTFATLSASSAACSCTCKPRTPLEHAERADVVVFGTVEAFEPSPDAEREWSASVLAAKVYKGKIAAQEKFTVVTPLDTTKCGVHFRVGRTFMVYAAKRGDGKLLVTRCGGTERMREAPLAPGLDSIVAAPPGEGDIKARTERAGYVFVGEVTKVGRGFAGSFHKAEVQVRVTRVFKGAKRGKMALRVNEHACTSGGSGRAFADLDLEVDAQDEAPVKAGDSYLFFAYDEQPHWIAPCHENILELREAAGALVALKSLCAKGACERMRTGFDEAKSMRRTLRKQLTRRAKSSIASCATQHELFGRGKALTELDWDVAVTPEGKLSLANISAIGTYRDAAFLDVALGCLEQSMAKWEVVEFTGSQILVKMNFSMEARGSRPAYKDVVLQILER